MNLLFPGMWSWWRQEHTGSHRPVTVPVFWSHMILLWYLILTDIPVDASLLIIQALFCLHIWVLTSWSRTGWCTAEPSPPTWCAAGIKKGIVERGQMLVDFPPPCWVWMLAACSEGASCGCDLMQDLQGQIPSCVLSPPTTACISAATPHRFN